MFGPGLSHMLVLDPLGVFGLLQIAKYDWRNRDSQFLEVIIMLYTVLFWGETGQPFAISDVVHRLGRHSRRRTSLARRP